MSVMVPTTDELKALMLRVKDLEERLGRLEKTAVQPSTTVWQRPQDYMNKMTDVNT